MEKDKAAQEEKTKTMLNMPQIMERYGVSEDQVYEGIASGGLPIFKHVNGKPIPVPQIEIDLVIGNYRRCSFKFLRIVLYYLKCKALKKPIGPNGAMRVSLFKRPEQKA